MMQETLKYIDNLQREVDKLKTVEAAGSLIVDTSNVSNPPTDAQLDTAFGTPAAAGAGFVAMLDDNGANTNVYLVSSNGTSWWYLTMTKAT